MSGIAEWFNGFAKSFSQPKRKRLELRLLSYDDADKLLREPGSEWEVAVDENHNGMIGMVYLERLEPLTKNKPPVRGE